MSQREKDFNGGIKQGCTAYDIKSKKLDKLLKHCRDNISIDGFRMVKQFSNKMKCNLLGDDCFGFAPDGGAWFKGDKLVAVFEGKKQGFRGNANERWFKNAVIAKHINPDVFYVTFCSGEGSQTGECLEKMERLAKITMGDNFVYYRNPCGFTVEEAKKIMIDTIRRCI